MRVYILYKIDQYTKRSKENGIFSNKELALNHIKKHFGSITIKFRGQYYVKDMKHQQIEIFEIRDRHIISKE